MNWKCKKTWKRSKINTLWCLLGCSIGDFGTIFYFQNINHSWNNFEIMGLAIINGLITSIILETIILLNQMNFLDSLKTALGMSFISMIGMELAMNFTDLILTGGAILTWWVVPLMLLSGFYAPLPYNYWRLKKFNISCH
jgi:predicted acyltransferase